MIQVMDEYHIIIDGDEAEIWHLTMIQEIQEVKDSDHVQYDIMCLVMENGEL